MNKGLNDKNLKIYTLALIILFVVALISGCFLLFNDGKEKESTYSSNVNFKERATYIDEVLDNVDDNLKQEIESNIDAELFGDELSSIPNRSYYSALSNLITKADKYYKDNNSSLSENLNKGTPLDMLLIQALGEEYINFTKATMLGNEENTEYSQENSNSLYNRLLVSAYTHSYNNILSSIDNVTQNYKISMPYNYKLGDLYHDAEYLKYNDLTSSDLKESLSHLKDKNMYLISIVNLLALDRVDLIDDPDSFILNSQTQIKDIITEEKLITSEDENNIYRTICYKLKLSETTIYEMTFTDSNNNNKYKAYVYKNLNGDYQLYKIEGVTVSNEQTVNEYKKEQESYNNR